MTNTTLVTLTNNLASRFNLGDGSGLMQTLKNTAFKGNVSDDQMVALLVVANQYGLNPWTREIYAFPDRNNGIVPIVGVDGWARIINSDKNFDGMDFEQDNESCTCKIYRKDRTHPICVTEWMSECKRESAQPWKTHPKRMLRHKAMIQCARIAFGFGGIFDEDEAERIKEGTVSQANNVFTGDSENPKRSELIKVAEAIANTGNVDALRDHFKSLEKADRVIIGQDEMKRLAAVAESVNNMADAEIIEHSDFVAEMEATNATTN